MKEIVGWLLKGAAMGAANVIPGVSGGTIAFITGIFERLIQALKSVDLEAAKLLLSGKFSDFAVRIDLKFLFFLFFGVGVSILSLAKALEIALTRYEALTLSFFFGLIIASVIGVGRQIGHIGIGSISSFLIGTTIAVLIAFLPPASANEGFFYVFICGIVAVCSMILPGLSGSYILLLMGNYVLVLQAISSFNFSILIPLGLGCVLGILVFSRILNYLFGHFRNQTIGLLTGFVAGSLLIIWPWKSTQYIQVDEKLKPVSYEWLIPSFDSELLVAIFLMIVGFVLVFWMERRSLETEAAKN